MMFKLPTNCCKLYPNLITVSHSLGTPNVRGLKKPIWLPQASSKIFKIKPRIRLPEDETEELKRLNNIYRTEVKSVRKYLADEYQAQTSIEVDVEAHNRVIQEDFELCSKINDEWNTAVRAQRESRVEKESLEMLELAKKRLELAAERETEKMRKANELIREQIKASEHFILPEKIDEVIEYVVNNPVDYNFAIDLDGNRTLGRETEVNEQNVKKASISQ